MKILFVCSNLGFGGAERVAVTLANGFHTNGHKVIMVANLFEKINYSLDKDITVENLVSTNRNKYKKWISSVRQLRKSIKSYQPDVIIGIMELCSLIARISALGTNIPVVATDHYTFDRPLNAPFTKQEWFFKFVVNYIYRHITVLTEADKKVIGDRFRGVTVMPNPLFIPPIKQALSKEKVLLSAGRIDAWFYKGFDVLLQAWKILYFDDYKDSFKEWWLKIAGAGKQESFEYLMNLLPDGEWVHNKNVDDDDYNDDNHINTKHTKEKNAGTEKQYSQKYGVWRSEKYHIEFLGFRKDIEELYKRSAIFALSSRYEGFGLVLIEAMSQGCAPVACDYKGRQREIIGDPPKSSLNMEDFQKNGIEICENGLLCEPENVEALATALEKMIMDEAYRKKVQKNALERSKFYDMEHTMDRWEAYLKTIVNAD